MSGRYATEQGAWDSRNGIQRENGSLQGSRIGTNYRAEFDVRMDKAMNPKSLPIHIMSALISADRCPNCLGDLDTGYECNTCGFDAAPWLKASTAINDAAHDRREG